MRTAISYFNQAIEKDPQYALAYEGIADAYDVLPGYNGDANDTYPKAGMGLPDEIDKAQYGNR